jgi:hypothetical protein
MRKLKNSDNAVVGIVASFLIVGLVVSVIAVIQTQYVPKWMEEKEASHMSEIADQFAELNYGINSLFINKIPGIPISTKFTLGSKEMPYLVSNRAFGQLTIIPNNLLINIAGDTYYNKTFGNIKYNSINNYYLDQSYIYEGSGVILSQSSGSIMYLKQNIDVLFQTDILITLNLVNITTINDENNTISGYGPTSIQTEYVKNSYSSTTVQNATYINITTDNNQGWKNYLNSTLRKNGLNDPRFDDNYEILLNGDTVSLHFLEESGEDILVNVKINYVEIEAQISQGTFAGRG